MSKDAVRIEIRKGWDGLERELVENLGDAQKVLDLQVLKDCAPYVPRDTGNLVDSGTRATDIGSGEVVWDAPYADKQYYTAPNKAHDRHPLAVMQWFEAAKAVRKDAWLRVAKKAGGR